MDFNEFVTPVSYELQEYAKHLDANSVGNYIQFNGFNESEKPIVLLAIPEYRHSELSVETVKDIEYSSFRKSFYSYQKSNWNRPLIDLGTIYQGDDFEDTCFAFHSVAKELNALGAEVFVIGGTQALTYILYKTLPKKIVEVATVDFQLDLQPTQGELNDRNFVSQMIFDEKVRLLHYVNIGSQAPYVGKAYLDILEQLNFNNIRLGKLTEDLSLVEPAIREASLLSVDLNSLQNSDFKSSTFSNPNGFNAREICGIMNYAGHSKKIKNIFISNYIPNGYYSSDALLAQMVWYFLEARNNQKSDEEVQTFRVQLEDNEMVFFKSIHSEKWWMEVKADDLKKRIPCHKKDYEIALKGEIPERWWRFYKKFY